MDDIDEYLWKIYDSINSWIRFSDSKAAIVLTANGVILTLIYSNISKFFELINNNPLLMNFFVIFITIGTITSIISIIYSINCLIPRINIDKKNIKYKNSLLFFKDINDYFKDPNTYLIKFKEDFNNENLNADISQEIWVNSKIATSKYNSVKYSIGALGITILLFIFTLSVILIIYG